MKWHSKGQLLGPFKEGDEEVTDIREAPVFTVNKPDGGRRPVSDATIRLDDGGPSVNETIKLEAPEIATVEYLQIQQMIAIILLVGVQCQVWAKDLQEGYYNLRVKESQIRLTAFIFFGIIFIPLTLQMGLSSAPYLFTAFMFFVVEAMICANTEWTKLSVPKIRFDEYAEFFPEKSYEIVNAQTVSINLIVYYLDDMFGFQRKALIWKQYKMAQKILLKLGLSAQEKKDRKPASVQLMLGLLFDCDRHCIRIPPEKGRKYIEFADKLLGQKSVTKRELFSLTGKARHLAIHIPTLAAFARGVEVYGFRRSNGHLLPWRGKINMCSTLKLAVRVLRTAIKRAMTREVPFDRILRGRSLWTSDVAIYTDAAGRHGGIGGYSAQKKSIFYQIAWTEVQPAQHHDIHWKEMVAVLVMLKLVQERFRNKFITIWCDNKPVVGMLIGYKAKVTRPDLLWIITKIADICMECNISPWYEWIEGTSNTTADKLSRFLPQPFAGTMWSPWLELNDQARKVLNEAITETSKFTVDLKDCVF